MIGLIILIVVIMWLFGGFYLSIQAAHFLLIVILILAVMWYFERYPRQPPL